MKLGYNIQIRLAYVKNIDFFCSNWNDEIFENKIVSIVANIC